MKGGGGHTVASESVKGVLVVGAVVGARRARDRLQISPEAMAARLSGEALGLVDQKIDVARWYPVRAFGELIDWAWEMDGHREPGYLERQGAISADRLFDSKRYQQLDYAERAGSVESRAQLVRQSRLITTILGTFYNFLETEVTVTADALEIVYGNAEAFGDPLVHTTIGFKNQINVRQGSKRRWTGARIRPDAVRFRMALPARLAEES